MGRLGIVAAGVLALGVLGWGFFHPDFRPDATLVSPPIRAELAKTGFTPTQRVSGATFKTVESAEGLSEEWTNRQRIVPVDALITEKRSRRQTKAASQESSGLYVGPLMVVRFSRTWPPILGELLPYHFWSSSRLSEFVVEEAENFPGTKGGRLIAKATYEEHYAGGELAQAERIRLRCDVANVVDASSVNARLSGAAARIECKETLEADGRRVGASNPGTYFMDDASYSHWYILNQGWSIPIEGENAVRVSDVAFTRKWSSKLVSFD